MIQLSDTNTVDLNADLSVESYLAMQFPYFPVGFGELAAIFLFNVSHFDSGTHKEVSAPSYSNIAMPILIQIFWLCIEFAAAIDFDEQKKAE